jgi:hypothetical protein
MYKSQVKLFLVRGMSFASYFGMKMIQLAAFTMAVFTTWSTAVFAQYHAYPTPEDVRIEIQPSAFADVLLAEALKAHPNLALHLSFERQVYKNLNVMVKQTQ